MPRPLRIEYPGAVYHVMNRATARKQVFRTGADYKAFLDVLAECHALWGIEVFAYCLMGGGYHLCFRTPEANLSRVMRHLFGLYTQRFNQAHDREGPLFRGRYKAIVVEKNGYLPAVVRYLHLSPVAARLVIKPEAYRWSSHGTYVGTNNKPSWLNVSEVLKGFPSRRAFHRFVVAGNDSKLEQFYRAGRQSPILGSDRFRGRFTGKDARLSAPHSRKRRRVARPSLERILAAVAKVYRVPIDELRIGRRGEEREGRKVAMYLVKRLCDVTLQETAGHFGVTSFGSVAWACHQVRTAMAKDQEMRRRVQRIERAVKQS